MTASHSVCESGSVLSCTVARARTRFQINRVFRLFVAPGACDRSEFRADAGLVVDRDFQSSLDTFLLRARERGRSDAVPRWWVRRRPRPAILIHQPSEILLPVFIGGRVERSTSSPRSLQGASHRHRPEFQTSPAASHAQHRTQRLRLRSRWDNGRESAPQGTVVRETSVRSSPRKRPQRQTVSTPPRNARRESIPRKYPDLTASEIHARSNAPWSPPTTHPAVLPLAAASPSRFLPDHLIGKQYCLADATRQVQFFNRVANADSSSVSSIRHLGIHNVARDRACAFRRDAPPFRD